MERFAARFSTWYTWFARNSRSCLAIRLQIGAQVRCRIRTWGLTPVPYGGLTPDVQLHTSATDDRAARLRDLTAGTLVHRLIQFGVAPSGKPDDSELAHALTLLKPEERAALEDVEGTVRAAVAAWRSMRTREDVASLLASGNRLHEVPFSLLVETASSPHGAENGPTVLRGTIDCLIRRGDGSVVVVEFKSGSPRAFHQRQLDLYVEAARGLFPWATVGGRLIYPDNPLPGA